MQQMLRSTPTTTAPIRILVADDHEVMRLGIRNLVEARSNWSVCAEACDGKEAIEKALQFTPDVIIMDIAMPEMNGLEAANQIKRTHPQIPVILFSLHLSKELVRQFDNGVIRGAVCKSDAARDLLDAIDKVLSGGTFFPRTAPASFS
jgi:DNA-binding NarL/FixJ family response regulator